VKPVIDWGEFFSVIWPAPNGMAPGLPAALSGNAQIFQDKEGLTSAPAAVSSDQAQDLPSWGDQISNTTPSMGLDHGFAHEDGSNSSLSDGVLTSNFDVGSSAETSVDNSAPGSSATNLGSLPPLTQPEPDPGVGESPSQIAYNGSDRDWSLDSGTIANSASQVPSVPPPIDANWHTPPSVPQAESTSSSQAATPVLAFMGDAGTGFGVLTTISGSSTGGSGGGSTTTSSGTLSSTSGAGSGLIININWDASVANAPTGFVSGVESVVQFFESHFSNPISITIDVGYGEVAGVSLPTGDLGASESYLTSVSYSQLETALANNANALGYSAAAASLPGSSPVSGANYWASTAEAAALGLTGASSSLDGYVGFSSKYNFAYNDSSGVPSGQYDFFGVVAHEITEVMGRTMMDGAIFGSGPGYQPLDLFHYSAPGVHSYVGSTAGYFSADGGTTNLGNFNTSANGDYADWAGSVGRNAFLAFSGGGVNPVTANDLTEMNLLGWTPSSTSTAPAVTMQLAQDTGASATDHITANPGLSGTADANAVVTLTEGSTVLGTTRADSTGAWSFTPTGLPQGAQIITASETNSAGVSGSTSLSFTLDTTAPTVTMQLAHDTGTSTDHITSNPALSGTADANAVVTLTEGTTVLGTTTANSSGVWSFTPTGLPQGSQTVTASETNSAGLTGNASLSFTLTTVAAAITAYLDTHILASSTTDITSSPTLSGSSDPNAVVTLTEGTTVLGTTTADATGAWSFTPTGLPQGAQTITASETGGKASVSFAIDKVSYATGVTATSIYNADGSLHALVYQNITGQKWTSTETLYMNAAPTAEVWANGATTVKIENWNGKGSIHDIHYYHVSGQPFTDYDVVYGSNGKAASATYSNGMTANWTYNSDGSLHDVNYEGVVGHKWTSIDTFYVSGKHSHEIWDNGTTTVRTETWNSDGSIHDVHHYDIVGQTYTDYDVSYLGNKPASATYSNGMTADWTYNGDGTSEEAFQNNRGLSSLSSANIFDPHSSLNGHLAVQENLNTSGSQTLHGYENGLTIAKDSTGLTVTLPTADSFKFLFDANTKLTGGGSNEQFAFGSGFGHTTISDFIPHSQLNTNNDTIVFSGGLFANYTDLLHHMSQNRSGDTIITDGHGDTLTLLHVSMAQLQSSDFLLS
jgi:Big-like domain-containing protein